MQNKNSKVFNQAVTIVGVVALTTVIGVVLSAQMGPGRGQTGGPGMGGPGGHGMRGGPGMMGEPGEMGGPLGMLGRGMRELGVTDEQREQIRVKMQSHKAEFEGIAKRMMDARTALNDAITADTTDEGAIRAKAAELAVVEADAAVLRAKVHQDMFSVLTPEQQQKAKDLRGTREERIKERRQRMQERGPQIREQGDTKRGGSELV
jgi:periplasmic protein CpxP/Spy